MGARYETTELDAAQRRLYVRANSVLVSFVCALTHRASHRNFEPPIQVLPHRQAPSIENEPTVPVGHCLRKFSAHFLTGLTGNVAALRAIGRMYRVGSAVANLLSVPLVLVYRALAIAILRHLLLLSAVYSV